MGMAPNASTAIAGKTLTVIGVALFFVSAVKILAEWFRPREFAFTTGLFITMGGVESITARELFPISMAGTSVGAVNIFPLSMAVNKKMVAEYSASPSSLTVKKTLP